MTAITVALAGPFPATLEGAVRARLQVACEFVVAEEAAITARMADVDILVSLSFTREMGAAARRLRLVQVPGAGLDRIDRAAIPPGVPLANVYGHEVGIAEFVLGAIAIIQMQFLTICRKCGPVPVRAATAPVRCGRCYFKRGVTIWQRMQLSRGPVGPLLWQALCPAGCGRMVVLRSGWTTRHRVAAEGSVPSPWCMGGYVEASDRLERRERESASVDGRSGDG